MVIIMKRMTMIFVFTCLLVGVNPVLSQGVFWDSGVIWTQAPQYDTAFLKRGSAIFAGDGVIWEKDLSSLDPNTHDVTFTIR